MATPVAVHRDREIYRTADVQLVSVPPGFQFCVENPRESDEGPTLYTGASIDECREFIDDEAEVTEAPVNLFDAVMASRAAPRFPNPLEFEAARWRWVESNPRTVAKLLNTAAFYRDLASGHPIGSKYRRGYIGQATACINLARQISEGLAGRTSLLKWTVRDGKWAQVPHVLARAVIAAEAA